MELSCIIRQSNFSITTFYDINYLLLKPAYLEGFQVPSPMPGAHLLKSAGSIHPDHGSWLQHLALMKSQTHKVSSTVGGSADQNPTVRQSIMYLH